MQVIGTAILVLCLAALAMVDAKLLPVYTQPFDEGNWVLKGTQNLTDVIRGKIYKKLANDTVAQDAVKDAPIQVLGYRGFLSFHSDSHVRVKLVSYFFDVVIHRDSPGIYSLLNVVGPVDESSPIPELDVPIDGGN